MGNSCSSRHRDKDNGSLHSEEYQLSNKRKSSQDSKSGERRPSVRSNLQSGVILKVSSASAPASEDIDHRRDSTTIIQQQQQQQQQQRKNGSIFISSHKDAASGKPLKPIITSQATTPDRNLCLPEDISELCDTYKQLLLGVIPVSKPILKAKKIVIYVCAADPEECKLEKGVLHGIVYPELRKMCRQEGYELYMADLHWKTLLEKRRDHKFPELCIFELNRQSETSYIVPVIFLNNSLGKALLPKTIEYEDFENTLKRIMNKDLLKKWYTLDENAQPACYRLQNIEQHIPTFKEENPSVKEEALEEWNNEVENMLTTLVSSFNEELRDTYFTTTIEQEIHNTMRMSQELTKHTIWLHRTPKFDDDTEITCPVRQENKRRLYLLLNELKNELSEKNIIKLNDGSNEDQIKSVVLPQFSSVMRSIIEDDRLKGGAKACCYGVDRLLLHELMIQTIHCQKAAAAHSISNYHNTVNILKNYILGEDERGLMVIHGLPGCGKSTVLARLLLSCQTALPNLAVIFRFVNISTASSSLELLLRSILSQIHYVISGRQLWEPHSISKYVELFPKLLSLASENRPVLIVIDGLDQLHGLADNIDWIPVLLPRNIKFIISVTESTTAYSNVQNKLQDTSNFVQIPKLHDNESETVLYTLIAESDSMSNAQLPEKIRSAVKNSSFPFYIKVVANQYSWLQNDNLNLCSIAEMDVQINQMINGLENILGKNKVELTLSLLIAARYGLTDSEMLDILSYEDLFHNDSFQVIWAPACIFWSEFNKYMKSFLRWFHTTDSIVLGIQQEIMREIIEKRYKYKINQVIQLLHTYFTGSLWDRAGMQKIGARVLNQPLKFNNNTYNTRKLEELPYHEYKLFNTLQKHFLEDHIWLYSKVCGCSVFQALEDAQLEKCSKKETNANLELIKLFLEEYASALNYDGRQFYSQFLTFLTEYKRKFISNTSSFYNTIKTVIQKPPVFSLLSYSDCLDEPYAPEQTDSIENVDEKRKKERHHFNVIKRIEATPNFIVTISTEMKDISVWDVTNCQLVRKLQNIPQPLFLEMIDEFRCVVLCDRELRIYDLNSGILISKMKGVMNQKMPYFGLHDSSHLVTLSRNRMYVNIMNIENGDLVTSFKAGEDRFLNSLLISGNGKILVCGDETQKPFPLLVWNLASRKLLYDLRIAHHDFITKLAAITYEGNYVCCVAKEVDEPSPNFIVVYDLQSGTLFKKWKPGVNCVSLDISSKDSCVLSGHQNGAISIWDLVTGACKFVLEGHTAPVTRLQLDAAGGSFLSTDSSGRDKSIRLWNLTTGELTAIYTPSKTIIASEILSSGKYVVVAMQGLPKLTILHLTGPSTNPFTGLLESPVLATISEYGIPENYGKIFDLANTSLSAVTETPVPTPTSNIR